MTGGCLYIEGVGVLGTGMKGGGVDVCVDIGGNVCVDSMGIVCVDSSVT